VIISQFSCALTGELTEVSPHISHITGELPVILVLIYESVHLNVVTDLELNK